MKSLAWRGILARALSTTSSMGYWPLEIALRCGNHENVFELLRRTGHLSFPPLVAKRASPFHHCVVGNSPICLDYLARFLKKNSGRNHRRANGNNPGGRANLSLVDHDNLTFENCLEWKNENDHSPLTLACSLSNRIPIIRELLLAGADIASANQKTHFNGFMYLCASGQLEAVNLFLSLQDINSKPGEREIEFFRTTSIATVRNSMKVSSSQLAPCPLSLSKYACHPNQREAITGKQAIHLAAENNHPEIILALLNIGISLAEEDNYGNTVYHYAVKGKNRPKHLLEKLISIEKAKHQYYQENIQPKGFDNMNYSSRPLLFRNQIGKLPLDVAIDLGEEALALILVTGMLEIYGTASVSQSLPASPPFSPLPYSIKLGSSSPPSRRRKITEVPFIHAPEMTPEFLDWLAQLKIVLEDGSFKDNKIKFSFFHASDNFMSPFMKKPPRHQRIEECKEENDAKEEKNDVGEGIEDEKRNGEEEDKADTLEYIFALTPLMLKTYHVNT
jgi:ankyrin repeat protein